MCSSLGLQGHELKFELHKRVANIVSRLFGKTRKVRPIPVSAFCMPDLVEILRDVGSHAIAGKLKNSASAQESRFETLCAVSGEDKDGIRRKCRPVQFAQEGKLCGRRHA